LGAGVESGGGGPSSFGAPVSGMGVWIVIFTNPHSAVVTFLDLDLVCGVGVVSPPSAISRYTRSFLMRLKPVDAFALGICVQCGTSTSAAASAARTWSNGTPTTCTAPHRK
jgi:hypothetical protein